MSGYGLEVLPFIYELDEVDEFQSSYVWIRAGRTHLHYTLMLVREAFQSSYVWIRAGRAYLLSVGKVRMCCNPLMSGYGLED